MKTNEIKIQFNKDTICQIAFNVLLFSNHLLYIDLFKLFHFIMYDGPIVIENPADGP